MNSKFAKKYAVLFYCAMLFVVTASASGQAGKLDPTFGIGGITTMRNVVTGNTNFFAIGAVAVQSDGKIVVAWHKAKGLSVSRFRRYRGVEVLEAENREYETVTLGSHRDWRIVGKILWWTRLAP